MVKNKQSPDLRMQLKVIKTYLADDYCEAIIILISQI